MILSEAVKAGRLEGLRALRDTLAAEIENPPAEHPNTAALARQLRDVLGDIADLEREMPRGSVVDDLASRRKTRRAGAAGGVEAAGDSGK